MDSDGGWDWDFEGMTKGQGDNTGRPSAAESQWALQLLKGACNRLSRQIMLCTCTCRWFLTQVGVLELLLALYCGRACEVAAANCAQVENTGGVHVRMSSI